MPLVHDIKLAPTHVRDRGDDDEEDTVGHKRLGGITMRIE